MLSIFQFPFGRISNIDVDYIPNALIEFFALMLIPRRFLLQLNFRRHTAGEPQRNHRGKQADNGLYENHSFRELERKDERARATTTFAANHEANMVNITAPVDRKSTSLKL